jgi:hypothetical protein
MDHTKFGTKDDSDDGDDSKNNNVKTTIPLLKNLSHFIKSAMTDIRVP